jgi:hypothetical protein
MEYKLKSAIRKLADKSTDIPYMIPVAVLGSAIIEELYGIEAGLGWALAISLIYISRGVYRIHKGTWKEKFKE